VDVTSVDDRRRSLWRTSWGVVLAAATAFSAGYAASRASDPSVGASRPPVWPLFISLLVVAVSLWFVLAPTLHQWPFDDRRKPRDAGADRDETPEP
jgi:hypothetical protein